MGLTYKQLIEFNIHLGHSANTLNESMNLYLYNIRAGIALINLNYTLYNLKRMSFFLKNLIKS